MRSASRLVIVALSVFVLALPALPAAASTVVFEQQPPSTAPANPDDTAPAGPSLEPADTEAEQSEQQRKIVLGVASVVLVGIVVWGRSVRRKRAKAK
ncbi:hypothetical protein [Actinophytocola gossypii]|uniref:LPXTG cell wall anchor domain-containing protein n=1 Tax=Actinophytocola gossypii TaxID=2812003 RepID=A0ABT2JE73_9PSEU|nr:hypothetical protein [Actinophytocola gossypii]MCT2586172.1 hypothetical protein [Actinophytocola gossypii]